MPCWRKTRPTYRPVNNCPSRKRSYPFAATSWGKGTRRSYGRRCAKSCRTCPRPLQRRPRTSPSMTPLRPGSERALGPFLLYRQSSLRPLGRLSLEGYRGLDFFSSSYALSVQTPRSSQQYLEFCLAENQMALQSLRQALSEGLTPSVCFLNLLSQTSPWRTGSTPAKPIVPFPSTKGRRKWIWRCPS